MYQLTHETFGLLPINVDEAHVENMTDEQLLREQRTNHNILERGFCDLNDPNEPQAGYTKLVDHEVAKRGL